MRQQQAVAIDQHVLGDREHVHADEQRQQQRGEVVGLPLKTAYSVLSSGPRAAADEVEELDAMLAEVRGQIAGQRQHQHAQVQRGVAEPGRMPLPAGMAAGSGGGYASAARRCAARSAGRSGCRCSCAG
jgi:hypothetical protein